MAFKKYKCLNAKCEHETYVPLLHTRDGVHETPQCPKCRQIGMKGFRAKPFLSRTMRNRIAAMFNFLQKRPEIDWRSLFLETVTSLKIMRRALDREQNRTESLEQELEKLKRKK